jgi:hypothetical protein
MGPIVIELLPFIIGAAVVPIWIIVVLLLLRGQGGLAKAAAFVAGAVVVRLVQGIVFGYVFNVSEGDANTGPSPITSTLLIVLGILLWIGAIRKWAKEEDPDAPPPKWMTMFNSISAPKAFGMGALLVAIAAKQWVFTLGALGVIRDAALGNPGATIAYLFFVLASVSLLLVMIIFRAVAPERSAKTLDALGKWMEDHNRAIVITISVIFGAFFLYKGITGLLG